MLIRGFFTNSAGILFSRVLGFLRDLVTAQVLGANLYSDIFFVAFKLPNLFRRIFAEGAFTQAFIPGFAAAVHKGRFSLVVFTRLMAVVVGLSLLVTLFSQMVTTVVAYGFSDEAKEMAAPLVALNFYYLDLIFVVTLLAALLQYRRHFATTAFATGLLNIAMIAALLISKEKAPLEIVYWLSYGVLAGGVLQVAVHFWAAGRYGVCRVLWTGVKKRRDIKTSVRRFERSFIPAIFGSSTAHISAFLDTFLASFLVAGSISYLYYANRILQLPLALFAIAASTALFPVVARAINRKDEAAALMMMGKAFWLMLFLLGASTVGGALLAPEIIWVLFERGAFSHADTVVTAGVLQMYMVGLLPFGLAKVFSLWLYSHHRQLEAAKISAIALGFNIVFSLLLITPMGVYGLALAGSLGGVVLLVLSLRAFGWGRFAALLSSKKLALFVGVMGGEVLLLLLAKQWMSLSG